MHTTHTQVSFLEDYFTNEPTSAMTLSLWYHGSGGLVCNTGCGDGGSFELAVTDQDVTAKLVTSSQATLASQVRLVKICYIIIWLTDK